MSERLPMPYTATKKPWVWWIFVVASSVLIVGGYELLRWIDPVDFYVYYYAGETALNGASIYSPVVAGERLPDGLPYNYGPAGILIFSLLSLAQIDVAFVAWSVIKAVLFAWVIRAMIPPHKSVLISTLIWLGIFIPTTVLAQEMLWGQINIILMFLCLCGAIVTDRIQRPVVVGVLVGIATAIKLTPGLFLIFFLFTKRWAEALWACVAGAVSTALAAVFFTDDVWRFFTHTLWDLSDRVALGENFDTPGNNSIQGVAAFIDISGWPVTLIVGIIAVAGLGAAIYTSRNLGLIPALLIIGMLSPLLSPVSWIHHFIFLLPGIVYLWYRSDHRWRWALAIIIAALLIQGTDLGGFIVENGPAALWPLGFILRESLLLSSMTLISALTMLAHSKNISPVTNMPTPDAVGGSAKFGLTENKNA